MAYSSSNRRRASRNAYRRNASATRRPATASRRRSAARRRPVASRQRMAAPQRPMMRSARPVVRSRRRFAQEVDPDVEQMVNEFGDAEITDDTAPIEAISGQGEVSDDLIEPEMAGDSADPVQDSITARKRRAAQRRRAMKRRAMMRRRAQEDGDAGTVDEEEAPTEEEIMEEVEAKFTSANRLAALQKQHGCISRSVDTVKAASRIASKHTKGEIDYAIACLNSVGKTKAKKASAKSSRMPRKASKKQTMTTYRKAAKGISSDASALFM